MDNQVLTEENAKFKKRSDGHISLEFNNKTYNKIGLFRMFPFYLKEEYICVKDDNGSEIGIIRNLNEFNKDTAEFLKDELEKRYFSPEIKKVISIKREYSYNYWQVETTAGDYTIQMSLENNDVKMIDDKHAIIKDIHGTYFHIPDIRQLDKKSFKKIELYIW